MVLHARRAIRPASSGASGKSHWLLPAVVSICLAGVAVLFLSCEKTEEKPTRSGFTLYVREVAPDALKGRSKTELQNDIKERAAAVLAERFGDAWRVQHVTVSEKKRTAGVARPQDSNGEAGHVGSRTRTVYVVSVMIGQYKVPPVRGDEIFPELDRVLHPDFVVATPPWEEPDE